MIHKIHKKSIIPAEVFLPVIEAAEYWRSPAIKQIPAKCLWTSRIGKISNSCCTWNGCYFTMLIEFGANDSSKLIYEAIVHELYHAYDYYRHGHTDEMKIVMQIRQVLNNLRQEDWDAITKLIEMKEWWQ